MFHCDRIPLHGFSQGLGCAFSYLKSLFEIWDVIYNNGTKILKTLEFLAPVQMNLFRVGHADRNRATLMPSEVALISFGAISMVWLPSCLLEDEWVVCRRPPGSLTVWTASKKAVVPKFIYYGSNCFESPHADTQALWPWNLKLNHCPVERKAAQRNENIGRVSRSPSGWAGIIMDYAGMTLSNDKNLNSQKSLRWRIVAHNPGNFRSKIITIAFGPNEALDS